MNEIKNAYDIRKFRDEAHKIVDLLADYLEKNINREEVKVIDYQEPEALYQKWLKDFNSQKSNDILDFYNRMLQDSMHIHHPQYMGHQVSPAVPASALAEFMTSVTNNSAAIYEMAPLSSVLERIIIEWLAGKIGFSSDAFGVLTSGGLIGNTTGLLAARQIMSGYNIWNNGHDLNTKPAIMVSGQAHYSMERTVKIMGWGQAGIIQIPVNKQNSMDVTKLESYYQKAIDSGQKVLAVVANICSTSTGTYDNINAIADFCEEKNLWLHADGAHGGPALFSDKYKHLIKGIERADSVVIDFHKMMFHPSLATAVIFKKGDHAYRTFAQKAEYLLSSPDEHDWHNTAKRSFECTKNAISVKIYVMLKSFDEKIFGEFVETTFDLAQEFNNIIKSTSDFETVVEPESNIVCFRYNPSRELTTDDLNQLNKDKRQALLEDGKFYIVQTEINAAVWLRVTLMNPFTTNDDLRKLLEEIRKI